MNEADKLAMEKIFGPPSPPIDETGFVFNDRARLEAKRIAKIRDDLIEDTLITSLKESKYQNPKTKETYLTLAPLYLSDLEENIMSNQFDLQKKYPGTSVDDWANFLKDKIVYTYIRKHRNAMLAVNAEKNLADPYARNKRDNLSLIRSLEGDDTENKPIVILRIPDIYDEEVNSEDTRKNE